MNVVYQLRPARVNGGGRQRSIWYVPWFQPIPSFHSFIPALSHDGLLHVPDATTRHAHTRAHSKGSCRTAVFLCTRLRACDYGTLRERFGSCPFMRTLITCHGVLLRHCSQPCCVQSMLRALNPHCCAVLCVCY